MSSLIDSSAIFRYHREMITRHGSAGIGALGWTDLQSQLSRFAVLATIADLNGHSVLDAGCGHADLREFLHQLYPDVTYIGMEQMPELLDEAIRRYTHWPKTSFIEGNFMMKNLPHADYIIACGSLSYQSTDPQFIFKAITKLFTACKLGMAFNLLSKISPNDALVAYDPERIMEYCESISKKVIKKMTIPMTISQYSCIANK